MGPFFARIFWNNRASFGENMEALNQENWRGQKQTASQVFEDFWQRIYIMERIVNRHETDVIEQFSNDFRK